MAVRANDMLFPSECDALLIRICVITGWQMPGIPMLQKAVKSEFEHYCRENCADLNPDEICYALRQFALEIKDWGKDINLQLIDEPIRSYRSVRHEVSALESEVPATEVKQISGCPEDFTEEWDRLIDGFDPVNPFYQLVPFSLFYDWLRRQNRIFPTGKNILDARDNVLARLQRKTPQLPHERQEIERMKCINWYKDPKVLRYISTEVKNITVKQLLHKLKADKNAKIS